MPFCLHFLNGSCQNEDCPYPHRKQEVSAPICSRFLRGYCEVGSQVRSPPGYFTCALRPLSFLCSFSFQCTEWHVIACPEHKTSVCPKGAKCRLPHRDAAFFEGKMDDDDDEENVISWRYFEKNKLDEKDASGVKIIPQRQSMGVLPDYIPLWRTKFRNSAPNFDFVKILLPY